jgi:flagella basal body P-ring formation protein FlgA
VQVTIRGAGFAVTGSGTALDPGAAGDSVRVRLPGKGGIATGLVEADGSVVLP